MKRARAARGIALVMVLWVVALLTVMALSLTTAQRGQSALTHNQIASARFRALADAAIHLTMLNLSSMPVTEVPADWIWVPDGLPRSLTLDGETLEIIVENDASRLDLNAMTDVQWRALLNLLGADPRIIDALADAILDWRDADTLTSLNGAEDADYRAAGLGYGARDAPFESVEELRLVVGMTPVLYRRLAPYIRVSAAGSGGSTTGTQAFAGPNRGGSTQVDPTFAPAPVLAVLQGIAIEEAEQLVLERGQPVVPGAEAPRPASRGGPLYRIRVVQRHEPEAARALEVLARLMPGGTPPFELVWRRENLMVPDDMPANGADAGDRN